MFHTQTFLVICDTWSIAFGIVVCGTSHGKVNSYLRLLLRQQTTHFFICHSARIFPANSHIIISYFFLHCMIHHYHIACRISASRCRCYTPPLACRPAFLPLCFCFPLFSVEPQSSLANCSGPSWNHGLVVSSALFPSSDTAPDIVMQCIISHISYFF